MRGYRVWDKIKNKYRQLVSINFTNKTVEVKCEYKGHEDFIVNVLSFEDIILEQETGLLDKNGKEIYEGDIVEFPDKYEWYKGGIPEWFKMSEEERVKWLEEQPTYKFVITLDKETKFDGITRELETHYQVVGNIHDAS